MFYDYVCTVCGATTTVKRSMASVEVHPECLVPCEVLDMDLGGTGVTMAGHGPMQRVYGTLDHTIQWSKADYIEKAYRGEESVPGLSQAQVRQMVHNDVAHAQKGRGLDARRTRQRDRSLRQRVG